MPETPGQIAHAAYVAAEHGGPVPPGLVATRWRCLLPSEQRGWEAAAQAVLDAWQAQPRLAQAGRQEHARTLLDEARPFFEDAFAGALERIELRPQGRGLRVIALVTSDDRDYLNRCLRAFDATWWLANAHRSNGLLVFDYETLAQTGAP